MSKFRFEEIIIFLKKFSNSKCAVTNSLETTPIRCLKTIEANMQVDLAIQKTFIPSAMAPQFNMLKI